MKKLIRIAISILGLIALVVIIFVVARMLLYIGYVIGTT